MRRVVDDDRLGEVAAEDVEVLDVVAVDADTVLAKQPRVNFIKLYFHFVILASLVK